jgi:hypothetical protein
MGDIPCQHLRPELEIDGIPTALRKGSDHVFQRIKQEQPVQPSHQSCWWRAETASLGMSLFWRHGKGILLAQHDMTT